MHLASGTAMDDAATIADLIWETDPEMCEFVFGDRETWHRCCAIEWLAELGLHSSSCASVAKRNEKIVGLLIAYPQPEMASRYAATVARYETNVGRRMEAVGWLFPVIPEKTLYVFNLAVAPALRGQGVGRLLLTAAEEHADRVGSTEVHLDAPATSPAVRFYERMGYAKLTETRLLAPATSIPSHYRMYKTLRC